jgi:hypothetical protein
VHAAAIYPTATLLEDVVKGKAPYPRDTVSNSLVPVEPKTNPLEIGVASGKLAAKPAGVTAKVVLVPT